MTPSYSSFQQGESTLCRSGSRVHIGEAISPRIPAFIGHFRLCGAFNMIRSLLFLAVLAGFLAISYANDGEPSIVAKGDILYGWNRTAVLQCTLVDGTSSPNQVEWYRFGEKLDLEKIAESSSSSALKYIAEYENNTLTVKYVGKDDLGEYTCVFPLNSGINFTKSMLLQAEPRVIRFAKSKNLVQGDPLQLECKAYGYPHPTIAWFKDGALINATDDDRISFKDFEDLINGTLRIENLDYPDRADYMCVATNVHGSGESVILVRVKDKLAALWPFLGICVEVAILCIIIFIYEKKRAKKMEEEERREEADHLTNSNDHKGKDDVRQRK